MEYRLKSCPFCKKQIIATAEKCQHCGEWLNEKRRTYRQATTETQARKPLSEKPLGFLLAVVAGLFGGAIGLLASPTVLFLLNRTLKAKDGKQPNRFLAWALIGIVGAPACLLLITLSTPPKTAEQRNNDKKAKIAVIQNANARNIRSRVKDPSPDLIYKPASTVKYTIRQVSTDSWQGYAGEKRIVDVNLSDKATEQTLKQISKQIIEGAPRKYSYTVVSFYLPLNHGAQRGAAWALVDSPGLIGGKGEEFAVRFNGLTVEEMSALYKAATAYLVRSDAVESWLETGVPPGQIKELVQRRDKSMGMRSLTPGYASSEEEAIGSQGKEVILIKEARGTKVEDKEPNEFGEYYIINPKGDLEYWSRDGHYFTAKNVKNIPR